MKISRKRYKVFFLLSCLFYFGCQPDGGDLTPVSQNGAKVVSFLSKANTALQYDNENFSIKVSGKWESLHGDIFCLMVVKNRGQGKIIVDFNKAPVANSLNEKLVVELVSTAFRTQTSEVIESKVAEINTGETLAFGVNIGEKNSIYKGDIKFRGNEIWMTIPVTFEQNKTAVTTDYYFKFKYDDYVTEGEFNGNLID
ncbi:MAG: hypothetical protein ACR2LT_06330 [Pyrinomonadaceae bacterium]